METSVLPLLAIAISFSLQFLAPNALATPVATPVVSDFDAGLDGWTGNSATWEASAGNPVSGGFMLFVEDSSADIGPFAPAVFLGDWSALDGVGSIRYDEWIIEAGDFVAGGNQDREVRISGPGGSATWIGPRAPEKITRCKPSTGCWPEIPFTIPISETAWMVTSGSWPFLLAEVTQLQIRANLYDTSGAPEQVGFDNIMITPEPATGSLLALGLGLVVVARSVWSRRSS